MSRFLAFVVSLTFFATAAVSANASTVANLTVSDGGWSVLGGDTITITGSYSGDATDFLSLDPSEQLPLLFGASLDVDGDTVFAGELGPITASPEDIVDAAFDLALILDSIVGDVVDTGLVDLALTGTGGQTGLASVAGTFSAVLTSTSALNLSDMINGGLVELGLLGTLLPQSFVFPTDASGTFEAELTIGTIDTVATVPLPAGLPLLGFGLVGLVALRRRRPQDQAA